MTDAYAGAAMAYDLFTLPERATAERVLRLILPELRANHGPILDIGAGSGAHAEFILEHLPGASVTALEPSPAMRGLSIARFARRPAWGDRVSVRPEEFFDATLPRRIGGALAIGSIGHFDRGERRAVLAELARRLPRRGVLLTDLREPHHPSRVEPFEFPGGTLGGIEYRGIAEAWPVGREAMRWRMTYLALEDERVLTEATSEIVFHHPSPERFDAEARDAGFTSAAVAGTPFRILRLGAE